MENFQQNRYMSYMLLNQKLSNHKFDKNSINRLKPDSYLSSIIPLDNLNELEKILNIRLEHVKNLNNKNSDIYFAYPKVQDKKKKLNVLFILKLIQIDKESYNHALNYNYSIWKEYYIINKVSKLVLYNICPSFSINYFTFNIENYQFKNEEIFKQKTNKKSKSLCICLEYSKSTLIEFIETVLQFSSESEIDIFWQIFFFQTCYIKYVLPYANIVMHNDLHLNNIMIDIVNKKKSIIRYKINNIIVYVPQQGYNIKWIDFGKSILLFDTDEVNQTSNQKFTFNDKIEIEEVQTMIKYINIYLNENFSKLKTDYYLTITNTILDHNTFIQKEYYHLFINRLFPKFVNPFLDVQLEDIDFFSSEEDSKFQEDFIIYQKQIYPILFVANRLFVQITNSDHYIDIHEVQFVSLNALKKIITNHFFWTYSLGKLIFHIT